jgi:aryl-alcohol dehydrogenase-like predicted oxidoreductase
MTAERIKNMPQDDWRRKSPNFNEPKLSVNLELVELLRAIAEKHGVEPGVVAVAWTLRHPAITAAIVGARNAKQVDGTVPAAEFRLSSDEVKQIDAFVAAKLT